MQFKRELKKAIQQCGAELCTVTFADLNNFREFNKKKGIGHDRTDMLLVAVISELEKYLRKDTDFLARRKRDAGDEFLILTKGFHAKGSINHPGARERFATFNEELRAKRFIFPSSKKYVSNLSIAFGPYELQSHDTSKSALMKAGEEMRKKKKRMKKSDDLEPKIRKWDEEFQPGDIDVEAFFAEKAKEREEKEDKDDPSSTLGNNIAYAGKERRRE